MRKTDITETRDVLYDDASKIGKNVGKMVSDVRDHASAHVDFVKSRANDSARMLLGYVRENPVQILAAAFVLGLLIGYTRRK